MPRREDEWRQIQTGRHVPYCTCRECTAQKLGPRRQGLVGWLKSRKVRKEKAKSHPVNCSCATCTLLRSVGSLDETPPDKGRIFKKLFGKT
jgi:hypothetical protein